MDTTDQFLEDCTILIIDDELAVQRDIIEMFADKPANLIAAPNAEIGIHLAKKKQPNLVLMDWNMPGMLGVEALQVLKKDPETQHIPVLIMTAHAITSLQTHLCLTLGADDFLKKPFDTHELIGRICAVLRQYRAKQQIEVQNQSLKKLSEEQSQLLSMLSHDLKSPLNSIEALVSLTESQLSKHIVDPEVQTYLGMITKIVRQERDLINAILEMHRFETLSIEEENQPILLSSWLQEQLAPFQNNTKQITVAYHCDDECLIYSIPIYLKKIVDNLVSNALKYSYPETTIHVQLTALEDVVILKVKDQGQGFHPEELDQVFQKFQKLSAKPTGGESSSGIGLYIVKSVVDRLGGEIQLVSSPKEGTEFIVQIPKNIPQNEVAMLEY
ncbi:MAG: hybrid sensor histidine kinase/response regulator [Flammeovirgaceae bacterium]